MINNTILLKTSKLKSSSDLDKNVDDSILVTSIADAQEIDIQRITGSALYNEVCRMVETDEISGTSTYQTDMYELLLHFIQPSLIRFALKRSIVPMHVNFDNRGLLINKNDNSDATDLQTIRWIETTYQNNSEDYANRLKDYLCDFLTKYTQFQCDTTDSYMNVPYRKKQNTASIFLKKKRR